VNECKDCGSTLMLLKKGKDWLCLSCFSKTKPVDSELENIVEDSIIYGLIYISTAYKKKLRKLESEQRARGEI